MASWDYTHNVDIKSSGEIMTEVKTDVMRTYKRDAVYE